MAGRRQQYARQQSRKKTKKPLTPKRLFVRVFLAVFFICVVAFTSGVYGINKFLDSKPMDKTGTVAPLQTEEKLDLLIPGEGIFKTTYVDSKRVNVLLYGTTDEGLADTIMLFSFDPDNKVADVISVPRDTYYEREGYAGGYLKINSVAHEGPVALAEAVHDVLLGIPINYYAMIDYKGVEAVVDSMGGVPMDVPMDMKYTSKKQNLYIDLKKGEQVLDGEHAVQFLRYRKGYINGDLGRVEAQQNFVKAAVKQAIGFNLPKVATSVVENVDSAITPRAMLYLAGKAEGMDGDSFMSFTLPGSDGRIQGLSFWVASEEAEIEKMLAEVYTHGLPVTTGSAIQAPDETEPTGNEE